MEPSKATVGQIPLDEYVNQVAKIYSVHDRNRTIWDVWSHTLHHASGIAKQIRLGATEEKLHIEIADFSLWLFTTILKLTGTFGQSEEKSETPQESLIRIRNTCSDLLWHKYPMLCPQCSATRIGGETTIAPALNPMPCQCARRGDAAEDREAKRKRVSAVHQYSQRIRIEKPATIDAWQQMFGAIFARNIDSLSLSELALHLLEELGEASDAMIRMYTYKEETFRLGEPNVRQLILEGQLADVFSRTFALTEKLNQSNRSSQDEVRPETVLLSQIIWQRYGSDHLHSFRCWHCKQPICGCAIILVPPTRSVANLVKLYQNSNADH